MQLQYNSCQTNWMAVFGVFFVTLKISVIFASFHEDGAVLCYMNFEVLLIKMGQWNQLTQQVF